MRWGYVVKLAIAIFLAQFAVGLLEGLLASRGSRFEWLVVSHAVSLGACVAIFAHFASRQPTKPFTHAWIALLTHLAVGSALAIAVEPWIRGISLDAFVIELLIVVCALVVGTTLGVYRKQQAENLADA